MFGILIPVKNLWLEFPGTLGFLFQLADRKGWIQQSSPWSCYWIRFLNGGFTVVGTVVDRMIRI